MIFVRYNVITAGGNAQRKRYLRMYRVSYINSNGIINHKVGFATEIEARKWIEENKEQNKILKLLVWNNDVDCYSTVEEFNKRGNARATSFYKSIYA